MGEKNSKNVNHTKQQKTSKNDNRNRKITENPPKTNIDRIKILYTNDDSLPNKLTELQAIVKIENPHIVIVTEIHPKNIATDIEDSEIQLDNFTIYRSSNSKDSRGTVIYVSKDISASPSNITPDHKECISINLQLKNQGKLTIGAIYRSPSNNDQENEELWSQIHNILKEKSSHHLLIGDFNLPRINWRNYSTDILNPEDTHNRFLNFIKDNYLTQHVNQPTRARHQDRPTILDLALTDTHDIIEEIYYLSPLGKSDHSILVLSINLGSEKEETSREFIDYDRGDYQKIKEELTLNWEEELANKNTDEQWELLKRKIQNSVKRHVPIKKVSNGKPFVKRNIQENINRKHRAWQRYIETKDHGK